MRRSPNAKALTVTASPAAWRRKFTVHKIQVEFCTLERLTSR
jgi:hypothetical protein